MRARLAKIWDQYGFILIVLILVTILLAIVLALVLLVQSPMEQFAQALDECLALEQFSRDECVDIAVRLTQDD